MSIITAAWGSGLVVGPVIGGFLCRPAAKYAMFKDSVLFTTYPYLPPLHRSLGHLPNSQRPHLLVTDCTFHASSK
jgi:hypothetical protein